MRVRARFLLLSLGVAGLLAALRPPSVPPPLALHPTARRAALAERHVEGVKDQVLTPTGHGPRTIRVSEDDLNVYLASSRTVRNLLKSRGVQAVQITLQPPAGMSLRAAVLLQGQVRNVQIDGLLAADPDLGLRFTATHAQIGRLPLPAALLTRQANALAAHFSQIMVGRMPITIQSVEVQGHVLVVRGTPVKRPRRHAARGGDSTISVTGPSFAISTSMSAPNSPVCTDTPKARTAWTNAS